MIQHLHTSGPSHVNSVPFYESDHQVTGVSDTRFRIYTNHIDTTKKLLVAAAKESAGIGDPLAITLNQSNELASVSCRPCPAATQPFSSFSRRMPCECRWSCLCPSAQRENRPRTQCCRHAHGAAACVAG